ncbi:MAG: endonuclease/exonuclease/phosphatase family protein [Vulcanimicrobiota bacterium]
MKKEQNENLGNSNIKTPVVQSLVKVGKAISLGFFVIFSLLFLTLLILNWINSVGIVSPNSPFYGFDYIPAYTLLYIAILASIFAIPLKKWKFIAAYFVLFLIFWLWVGDHSLFDFNARVIQPDKHDETISVLSLNVAQFHDGIEMIGTELEKIHPDVIMIQEHEHFGEKNLELVRKNFPSYNIKLGQKFDSGIFSLYPITEFNEIQLPSYQPAYEDNFAGEQKYHPHRHFLHAVIDKDGRKVHILCLRLIAGRSVDFNVSPGEVVKWGKYLLQTQTEEVKTMIDYMKTLEGPIIYGGDMNAPASSHILKPFYIFGTDVYKATHRWPGYTFPAQGSWQRLDFIFCNDELIPYDARHLDLVISDHLPVLAVMGFKNKEGAKK